jgi:DNA-binding transcriptional ArsR family regulator
VTAKLDQHAGQFKALGSPVRLAILRTIVQGAEDGTIVGDIQAKLDIPWSTLSHHLDQLTRTGLIVARREGTFIYHRADIKILRALTDYLWEDCCKGGKSKKTSCC